MATRSSFRHTSQMVLGHSTVWLSFPLLDSISSNRTFVHIKIASEYVISGSSTNSSSVYLSHKLVKRLFSFKQHRHSKSIVTTSMLQIFTTRQTIIIEILVHQFCIVSSFLSLTHKIKWINMYSIEEANFRTYKHFIAYAFCCDIDKIIRSLFYPCCLSTRTQLLQLRLGCVQRVAVAVFRSRRPVFLSFHMHIVQCACAPMMLLRVKRIDNVYLFIWFSNNGCLKAWHVCYKLFILL